MPKMHLLALLGEVTALPRPPSLIEGPTSNGGKGRGEDCEGKAKDGTGEERGEECREGRGGKERGGRGKRLGKGGSGRERVVPVLQAVLSISGCRVSQA